MQSLAKDGKTNYTEMQAQVFNIVVPAEIENTFARTLMQLKKLAFSIRQIISLVQKLPRLLRS